MGNDSDRRRAPRLSSCARILWCVSGDDFFQLDRLRDVSKGGALVLTESIASIGSEIEFELLGDDGADDRIAKGLARVVWIDLALGMGIEFLEMQLDAASIAARSSRPAPPPLPGVIGGPPPLRLDRAPKIEPEHQHEDGDGSAEVAPQIEPLSFRRRGIVLGIDLGTTNTCASYVSEGRPHIIPGRTGTSTIPSVISIDETAVQHVGQRAADRQILYPLRTIYGSKRLLGRTFRTELAAQLQSHFAYPLAEAEGQRFGARIGDAVISMDAVATQLLREVKEAAETYLKTPIEDAVITVPAYFSEVQRDAVRRAGAEAGLTVHRIVNEPTAAAVAYGHHRKENARIAVWDFGGGTFDFSVVDVHDQLYEVVATGGDCFVGGSDFDNLLASHLLSEFQKREKISFEPTPEQIARLRDAAEAAKRALSVQTEYVARIPQFVRDPSRDLALEITRETFDELTRPLIERTTAIALEVMSFQGIVPREIDEVVLVGGTTRLPSVQQAVAALFGRKPSKRINPDEAVALGAALIADELGSPNGSTLVDVLPMSIGRATSGCRFEPLVARNARLPTERTLMVQADSLGAVTIPLFQGEHLDAKENEYLCSIIIEDESLWNRGQVSVRLSFDEHCMMVIDARDARTGRPLHVELDRKQPVDEVLRDLGLYDGPQAPPAWQLPESRIGGVFSKLWKLMGR